LLQLGDERLINQVNGNDPKEKPKQMTYCKQTYRVGDYNWHSM